MKLTNKFNYRLKWSQKHNFHLVDPSPWPIVSAFSALLLVYSFVLILHGFIGGWFFFKLGLISLFFVMYCWWRDVIWESTYECKHTWSVQLGLKIGMLLFILSEIMFFFSFFWAFFHVSINPSVAIGGVWPPAGLTVISPWGVPLLNTIILLSSGASITWAHHSLLSGDKKDTSLALVLTVLLAIIFTGLQAFEYLSSPFYISDGVYGSTFYMTTGFHGFHVLIGTCFLIVCFTRLYYDHFTTESHIGFECAAWYWHFVDVVWLFLFITIYWWGS